MSAVAIVGIGCRFPGGVADAHSFWQLLRDGRDAIGAVPPSRFDVERLFDPRPATPGRVATKFGGFLDAIEDFDAAFFGISPREAERLDPQQRLLLETAWEALEDAGIDATRLDGSPTGVFVGQWLSEFESRLFADPERIDFLMTTGSGRYAASGRISYTLGLRGPSLTLDTACSSSLVAVHLALRALRSGDCTLALAGGANVILQPHITLAYSQSGMMARDGRCKFGDARGDGYVRSEGAGIVALKRLDDAVAAGDRIYAVIRGSAVNNDGRSSGSMGTPSVLGQEELLRAAYADAQVDPQRVGYVEAHGTGTRAGDPVELAALGRVLGAREGAQRCWVGSVKTNFGHTEGAAGVAGLIKAALVLHQGEVPASLHFQQPNPDVAWAELPLRVATERTACKPGDALMVAGVSAFGIAGTNAHAVLEAMPAWRANKMAAPRAGSTVLPLSARSAPALRALAGRYADCIEHGATPLAALCHAAATRRSALEHRAAFVADDRAALVQALRAWSVGDDANAATPAALGQTSPTARPRIVFVFPGQGAQWPGMVGELMRSDAGFAATLARCDEAARPWLDVSLRDVLLAAPDVAAAHLERIDVVQPVLVALAIAYAQWLRVRGIVPDAVIGHSMGEVAAAHVAGALSLEDSMRIICRRSALMRSASGRGAMALVELSMQQAQARITGHGDRIAVAVNNSPRSCVLSGEPAALQEVMQELEADGVFCRLVNVDVASHSPQMDAPAAALAAELATLAPRALDVPMFSTSLGRNCEGAEVNAAYWARNLRQPVRFAEGVQQILEQSAAGTPTFVELGPHPVLLPAVQQTAQANGAGDVITLACGRRDEPDLPALLGAVGALWSAGATPEWAQVHGVAPPAPFVELPKVAWQRERHWLPAAEVASHQPTAQATAQRPSEEALGWLYTPTWLALDAPPPGGAPGSCVVAGDDDAELAALADALGGIGWTTHAVALAALTPKLSAAAPQAVVVLVPDTPSAPHLPLRALQALQRAGAASKLWFVTRGAQALDGHESPAVYAAAAWGSARVVADEHPEIWGGLVDLDPALPLVQAAHALHAELLGVDGEDQVAWRGARRSVPRWLAHPPGGVPLQLWRADGTLLITGGLGGVGQHLARAAVAAGARRLVLLNRRALPARDTWRQASPDSTDGQRIAAVLELEAAGAEVHTAAVDVGDAHALQAWLDGWHNQARPPIRAVVHAAGTLHNALAARMDPATFDAALRPKLNGAVHLDRLLPELDLFVMVSSTGAWLAQAGQANYAAANAGLDALAQARRARGQRGLSIGWGVWRDTGLVNDDAGALNVAEMARQGIAPFAPEYGRALFTWLCAQAMMPAASPAHVLVLPIDWILHARTRAAHRPGWLRARAGAALPTADAASAPVRLAAATPAARRGLLDALVREAVGQVLKLAPSRIDARKTFGSMGVTSLLAMELRNRLEAALERPLSATLAWNHPTIDALVAFLAQDSAPPAPAAPAALVDVTAPAALVDVAAVAQLSDDEAALALRARRSGVRR